jgi:hypothetical protein
MPPVGFEPMISAGEQTQTYALDCVATGTGSLLFIAFKISVVSLQVALSVLNPDLKPYCSVLNKL